MMLRCRRRSRRRCAASWHRLAGGTKRPSMRAVPLPARRSLRAEDQRTFDKDKQSKTLEATEAPPLGVPQVLTTPFFFFLATTSVFGETEAATARRGYRATQSRSIRSARLDLLRWLGERLLDFCWRALSFPSFRREGFFLPESVHMRDISTRLVRRPPPQSTRMER